MDEGVMKFPFQLKKFANYGSSHPAPARLFLQMADLLQITDVPEGDREQIRQHLFRASDEMVKAEEKKNAFIANCQRFHESVREGRGIRAQQHALELDEPEGLADDYQLFLIRLVIGLRMAIKAAKIILDLTEKRKWEDFTKEVERRFGAEHPLTRVIRKHGAWTKDLFEVRGDVEHDPYIFQGFKVLIGEAGIPQLVDPKLPDGRPAPAALAGYYDDGFVFAEELVVEAIKTRLPGFAVVREIPEEQRDPGKPIRYVLDLATGTLPP